MFIAHSRRRNITEDRQPEYVLGRAGPFETLQANLCFEAAKGITLFLANVDAQQKSPTGPFAHRL